MTLRFRFKEGVSQEVDSPNAYHADCASQVSYVEVRSMSISLQRTALGFRSETNRKRREVFSVSLTNRAGTSLTPESRLYALDAKLTFRAYTQSCYLKGL